MLTTHQPRAGRKPMPAASSRNPHLHTAPDQDAVITTRHGASRLSASAAPIEWPTEDDPNITPLTNPDGTPQPTKPDKVGRSAPRQTLQARPHPTHTGARTTTVRLGDIGEAVINDGHDEEPLDGADPFDALEPETPPRAATIPGHLVMERAAITKALQASGFDGSYDALSGGEETRARTLVQLRRSDLWRPHVIGTPAMLVRLDELGRQQGNLAAVIGLVRDAVHLSMVAGTPIKMPPILICGSPGIGKSRFARGLAHCLEVDLSTINGSTIPDVGSITGYPPVWRSPSQGRLAKFVLSAKSTSPIIFVDECEKIDAYEEMSNPLDKLLTALEPSTACAFQDENLQVPMRCANVIFLFACNALSGFSEAFLDRVVTFRIPDLHRDQRDEVLEAMLAEVVAPLGFAVSLASRAALEPLHALGLRRSRLAFGLAVARAVANERRFITRADLAAAVAQLGGGVEARAPVGFVRLRE